MSCLQWLVWLVQAAVVFVDPELTLSWHVVHFRFLILLAFLGEGGRWRSGRWLGLVDQGQEVRAFPTKLRMLQVSRAGMGMMLGLEGVFMGRAGLFEEWV